MSLVETKREVVQKEKIRIEKQDAKEKGKKKKKGMKRSKSLAVIETKKAPRRLSERSFIDEERRLHEAYQLLLGEHHRRVKRRGSTPVSVSSTDRQQCQCLSKVTNECDGEGSYEWSQSIFNLCNIFNKEYILPCNDAIIFHFSCRYRYQIYN